MKKICVFILILITLFCFCDRGYADDSPEKIYDNYIKKAKEFNEFSIPLNEDVQDSDILRIIVNKIILLLTNEIKNNYKSTISLIVISILSSLLKTFVSSEQVREIGAYGCYCACTIVMVDSFKLCADLCGKTIENLVDFMTLSVPAMTSLLSFSGFYGSALSMQGIFVVVTTIFNKIIVSLLFPFYMFCGIFAVLNGVSKTLNLSRFISLATKTVTYLMGILMIIFSGILTFSGLSTSARDNFALKTAKYTVSSFVPVVGGCLSESISGIMYSSAMLKNTVGYLGFWIVLSICIIPVIKMSIIIFMYKICASSANLMGENEIATLIDSICSVIISMLGLLLITSVVFVLYIGVIASIGG